MKKSLGILFVIMAIIHAALMGMYIANHEWLRVSDKIVIIILLLLIAVYNFTYATTKQPTNQ